MRFSQLNGSDLGFFVYPYMLIFLFPSFKDLRHKAGNAVRIVLITVNTN